MQWLSRLALLVALGIGVPAPGIMRAAEAAVTMTDPRDMVAQGRIYIHQNKLPEAEAQFLSAIDAWKNAADQQPFSLALTHGLLADVYRRLGDVKRAAKQYRAADSILETLALRVNDKQRNAVFQHRGRLANDLGLTYSAAKDYANAEVTLQRSLALKSQGLPNGHIDFAVTYANLAEALYYLGRYDEARLGFQRSIDIREPILGTAHIEVGRAYGYLAAIAVQAEMPEKAIALYQKAVDGLRSGNEYWYPSLLGYFVNLENLNSNLDAPNEAARWVEEQITLRRQYRPDDRQGLAEALLSLGLYRLQLEQPADAISALEEALTLGNPRALPAVGYDPGEFLIALSSAHEMLGNYELSIEYSNRAVALAEDIYGPNDARIAPYLQGYAGLLGQLGQFDDVPSLLSRAVSLVEAEKGLNHPDLIKPLMQLQNATSLLGQFETSVWAMKRALAIAEEHGVNNATRADLLQNLGLLLMKSGQVAKSEPILQEALELYRLEHGSQSLEYANVLSSLAGFHEAYGEASEAITLGEAALAIREMHPEASESIAISLNNLATAYRQAGYPVDPEPMYKRSIDLIAQALGANHPYIASPMNNLAGHLRNIGRIEEAEELYVAVLAIREKAFGRVHEKYANALNNLGVLYLETDRVDKAEATFREAIEIYRDSTGLRFLEAVRPLENLAEVMLQQQRLEEALPLYQEIAETQAYNLTVDHWDYRYTQSTIAGLHFDLEQFQTALDIYRDLLEFLLKAEGPEGESTINVATMIQALEGKVGQPH